MSNYSDAALYNNVDKQVMKIAEDSLNPKIDRVQEIIEYAKTAQLNSIGIAHCIAFKKEAEFLQSKLELNGFKVAKVDCKYGKIPFNKIVDGYKGVSCNPAGQAKFLADNNTQLNIMMGLCVGHDMIFNQKSTAPVTPLVVKDRKLKHKTVESLSKGAVLNRN